MAQKTLNARIVIRNNTAANFTAANPVLLKGEMGLESDTRKFKFGDGATAWNTLEYSSSNPAIVRTSNPATTDSSYDVGIVWINNNTKKGFLLVDNSPGEAVWKQIVTSEDIVTLGDMAKSVFATIDPAGGYVDKAKKADQLSTGRTISIAGDGTASGSFNGTANLALSLVLKNVVTAGTGCKLTVNAKGLVTGIAALSADDIPALTAAKITDLGTSATKNVGTSVGNVVVVNASGKIDDSLLPPLAITDVHEAASQTAMLALTAQTGDICIRSDINKTYILKQSPSSTLANWKEIKTPTDAVLSVNGQTGAITLSTSHISEGTNLYWTEARGTANFNMNFANKSVAGLSDGSHVLMDTDTFVLDGGN